MRRFTWIVIFTITALFTATLLLPIIDTDTWWIRLLDFPRIQFLAGLAISLCLFFLLGGWRSLSGKILALGAIAALLYQAAGAAAYLFPGDEAKASVCKAGTAFTVMVANVQKDNRLANRFFELVADTDPDILLVLETDQWWDGRITQLRQRFDHRHQHIPSEAEFYGMHLLSKFELVDPRVKTYVSIDTPTIMAEVILPAAGAIEFIGIHPRPPNTDRQPSTKRDANMFAAALDAREAARPVVMAGDFNATPWERTMLRARRIGALIDPRTSKGLIPTYSATNWAMAWPLDHILYQNGLVMDEFRRLPPFGSDHYAVAADLCLNDRSGLASAMPPDSRNGLDAARKAIEKAKAME